MEANPRRARAGRHVVAAAIAPAGAACRRSRHRQPADGRGGAMPPTGVKRPKRKRQYKKVLKSIKEEGRYKGRQKEVAARIVNKTRRKKGETKTKRAKGRTTAKRTKKK
jgi:hypothetical protein